MHYERWRTTGDLRPDDLGVTQAELLLEYLKEDTENCMIWSHRTDVGGYGRMKWDGKDTCVSRLVCQLIHGDPPTPEYEAAHGPCHNRACFNPKHLSWKTSAQNKEDKYRDNTALIGVKSLSAVLTEQDVMDIREKYSSGKYSTRDLALEYGIFHTTIWKVTSGKTWKHLLPTP